MKKIISLILALTLMCGCMLSLASCGSPKLEGTYSGSCYFAEEDDVFTITIGKNKTVSYSLKLNGDERVRTATGTYSMEKEEDHGHEVIKFNVTEGTDEDKMFILIHNQEFTYSLYKEKGKKVLELSSHSNSSMSMKLVASK